MPSERLEIEGGHGELDVGLEGLEARPGAAVQTKGAFARGDDPLDAGPPFAQLFVGAGFLDQLAQGFMLGRYEDQIFHSPCKGFAGVGLAGESGVGGDLLGQVAVRFFLPVEGRDESGGVGGIAALGHGIEDEIALTAGEQDSVAVDDFALPFFEDVGVRLENGEHLLLRGDVLAQ